jgi:hypothetical protein
MPESSDNKPAETPQSAQQQSAAPTDPNAEDAERKRKLQSLQLQRERILSERTSSPHRRTALTNALADIEEKLAELGWSIQLYP